MQPNKQAHLILATSLAGVSAVSSLTAAEVARLALALVPVNNQGETDVCLCDTQSCSMTYKTKYPQRFLHSLQVKKRKRIRPCCWFIA